MAQTSPHTSPVLDASGQVILLDYADLRARVNPQIATVNDELQATRDRMTRMGKQWGGWSGTMAMAAKVIRTSRPASSFRSAA